MDTETEDNYYNVLGIEKNSDNNAIKSAYRQMAMKWHPDKNSSDEAEKKFSQITKAYKTLSNTKLRKIYDEHNIKDNEDVEDLIDPYESIKEILKNDDIPPVIVHVDATIDDLYFGFKTDIKFIRFSECEDCDGMGTEDGSDSSCVLCKGTGMLIEKKKGGELKYMLNKKKCPECDATGINPNLEKCVNCEGCKYVNEEVEYSLEIPRGAYHGYQKILNEQGNAIPPQDREKYENKTRSNVIFVINQSDVKESQFKRGVFINKKKGIDWADILLDIELTFSESILGITKEIKYFGKKKIVIEIDEVIINNDIYILKGKGMPSLSCEGKKKGDLFLRFRINKPQIDMKKRRRIWQVITGTSHPKNIKTYKSTNKPIHIDDWNNS
jgi:molecular chaperone DnaJ